MKLSFYFYKEYYVYVKIYYDILVTYGEEKSHNNFFIFILHCHVIFRRNIMYMSKFVVTFSSPLGTDQFLFYR